MELLVIERTLPAALTRMTIGTLRHSATMAGARKWLGEVDAVLAGLDLQDAQGIHLVRQVRNEAPEVPLVVLSQSTDSSLNRALLRAGADAVVLPGDLAPSRVKHALNQATERRSLMVRLTRTTLGVQAIVEKSPDAIAVAKRGRYIYANGNAGRWLGARNGGDCPHEPGTHVLRVGEQEIELRVTPTMWGTQQATLIIGRDVTELRMRERQLVQTRNLRSLGQLAAGVAHEFNNLLMTMLGHAELLTEIKEAEESANAVREAGRRMAALVRQMGAFHRAPHRDVVEEVNDRVQDAIDVLRARVAEDVSVTADLGSRVECVNMAQGRLAQMLDAILDNALYYARRRVHIRTWVAGKKVMLEVADDGPGWSDDARERAAEPFFTTRDVGEGQGLGLTTAFAIVDRVGGQLHFLDSRYGGAAVVVELPHHRIAPSKAPAPLVDTNLTVLVAEDDDQLRKLTALVLGPIGVTIHVASDGREALRIAQKHRIDLLVTDVRMPRVDGPALARALRRQHPLRGVIYVSGYTEIDMDLAHDERYITKPFQPARLRELVAELGAVTPG